MPPAPTAITSAVRTCGASSRETINQAAQISGQLARRYGLPFRSSNVTTAHAVDAQAAYESVFSLWGTIQGGANFILHAAGWLEGGLSSGYEKFVMDCDQLAMQQRFSAGVDLSENGQAMDAIRQVGPGSHYLGCDHTQANFQTAFYRSSIADNNSYEQWLAAPDREPALAGGGRHGARRARSAGRGTRAELSRSIALRRDEKVARKEQS